jgi:hypothetical protein
MTAFSPDGNRVITVGDNGMVFIWPLHPATLSAAAATTLSELIAGQTLDDVDGVRTLEANERLERGARLDRLRLMAVAPATTSSAAK